jgi:hypothetical protein
MLMWKPKKVNPVLTPGVRLTLWQAALTVYHPINPILDLYPHLRAE